MNEKANENKGMNWNEAIQFILKMNNKPELNALNELSGVLVKKECKDSGPEHCMTKCKVCKGTGFITRELTNAELIEWAKAVLADKPVEIFDSHKGRYFTLPCSEERLELKE